MNNILYCVHIDYFPLPTRSLSVLKLICLIKMHNVSSAEKLIYVTLGKLRILLNFVKKS